MNRCDSSSLRREEALLRLTNGGLASTLESVRPFTMLSKESLIDLAHQVLAVLAFGVPGDFVECGVWRGGAAFLVADLLRRAGVSDRKVWLFDSFEGLPRPERVDGEAAVRYAGEAQSPDYHDNCRASLEDVKKGAAELGLIPHTEFVKGWFEESLPAHRDRIGPIALLRIDCDWYSSVRCCLENLFHQVADDGLVVFDDYYTWDGCTIAVHEFLAKEARAYRIEGGASEAIGDEEYHSAVVRKGQTTWRWMRRKHLTMGDIAKFLPAGHPFILVDQEQFGFEEVGGRRVISFLERDGEYWGPPPDEVTAIRELECLRRSGVRFIVFAAPAFWWLDHYTELRRHLRSRFYCALENDRVVIFDLAP
ncbi:MAG: TylF/MycF/NovP-related O-methyltransferase [Myxococcota bacterium]